MIQELPGCPVARSSENKRKRAVISYTDIDSDDADDLVDCDSELDKGGPKKPPVKKTKAKPRKAKPGVGRTGDGDSDATISFSSDDVSRIGRV